MSEKMHFDAAEFLAELFNIATDETTQTDTAGDDAATKTLQPLGEPQDADDWLEFTTPERQGIERSDAPPRIDWNETPAHFRRLVGNDDRNYVHRPRDHTQCDKCGNTERIKTIAGDKGQ